MKVVIAGAGIGGLALARGLDRRGVEVIVLERDAAPRRTGGYSLHLRAPAVVGLYEMLPTGVMADLHAVSQGPWNQHGFAVRNHRGRLLAVDRSGATAGTLDVDRTTLRVLLADGLGDRIRTGVQVVGHRTHPDGTVSAVLLEGEEVDGDVLVAADGVGSVIASALAGGPTATPTMLLGISGRTDEHAVEAVTRDTFGNRATLAIGPGGSGLYVGHHVPLDPTTAAVTSVSLPLTAGYVWGAIFLEWAQTAPLQAALGGDLIDAVADQLRQRGWRRDLRDLVERANPETVSAVRFQSGPRYAAGIAPWPDGPVTAIGDAVHAMPPTGGQGAGTAIRDAHVLFRELLRARDGHKSIVDAVQDYQEQMRGYAARAVAESLQPVTWTTGGDDAVGSVVARVGLPAAAAVSWAQRSARERTPV